MNTKGQENRQSSLRISRIQLDQLQTNLMQVNAELCSLNAQIKFIGDIKENPCAMSMFRRERATLHLRMVIAQKSLGEWMDLETLYEDLQDERIKHECAKEALEIKISRLEKRISRNSMVQDALSRF